MYSNNILPVDAAYYILDKATIVDEILTIRSGGSASYSVTKKVLNVLPASFRISIIPKDTIDKYNPTLYVYVHSLTVDGIERYTTLTPTVDMNNTYTQIIEMDEGEYELLTFEIYSENDVIVQLWELCPEAIDSGVEAEIDGVKQSLPSLLADFNTMPLVVDQAENTIGLITFSLSMNTDLQGHLSIAYVASDDCELTLRIKDTGVTELYTPIIYKVLKGSGVIALPHSYLGRTAGLHSTYVTCQVSAGTLTIGTRGLLYTIDGSYIATREIDAGMEVNDLSMHNSSATASPDTVWVVGISAGEATVKSCAYAEEVTSFVPQYVLGAAKAAAIEFDGYFSLDRTEGSDAYSLITEDDPYVFWIDNDDRLLCQKGPDESTRFIVDTGVSTMSACRGYKSELFPAEDQGLIILYVKDGVAMYKTYSYNRPGVYTWQGPFSIPLAEPVLDVNVHRLNDYRVGFVLTTATKNLWYISERTYISQAARSEVLDLNYDASPYVAVLPAGTAYTILATTELDASRMYLLITFNQDVHRATSDAAFLPEEFTGINVESVEMLSARMIRVKLRSKLTVSADFTYSTGGFIKFLLSPLGMSVPMMSFSSTATILPITNKTAEVVRVGYNVVNASITQRGLEYLSNRVTDTVAVSYGVSANIDLKAIEYSGIDTTDTLSVLYTTSGTITLTQVGTKPI